MSTDEERNRARQTAEARYGFLWHLPVYIAVNAVLVAVWYFSGAGFPWPIFPIVFWGLGLFGHYMSAYHRTGSDWIERETEKILSERAAKKR